MNPCPRSQLVSAHGLRVSGRGLSTHTGWERLKAGNSGYTGTEESSTLNAALLWQGHPHTH